MVIDVQHTINLWQMPAQASGQLRFTDILIPHALVQNHFDRSEGRQEDLNLSPQRGHRNVFSVVDACGNRLLQRIYRTPQRLIVIISECCQFRKIWRPYKYSPTILFKFNRITQHIYDSHLRLSLSRCSSLHEGGL